MKKAFLILLAASSSFTVLAQNTFVPMAGLVVNYNKTTINGSNAKAGVGYMAGLGYSMPLTSHLSFQPEVYYIQKSFSQNFADHEAYNDGSTTDASYYDKWRADYLEIPLLMKYTFMKGKMFAVLGPYLSIGLSGPHKYDYSTIYKSANGSHTVAYSGTDNIHYGLAPSGTISHRAIDRQVDFGFLPGIGYNYKKFQFQARAGLGFINLWRSRDSKNESLLLMVSYPFALRSAEE